MKIPLVIAHRGDSSSALENSLEAIRRALSYPVDMIEIDIRRSRDNMLYVMHDKVTFRTAEHSIDIERASSEEISRVKLKNGEDIPTLTDVIKLVSGKAGLNLEIKSEGAGLATAEYLASSDYHGYVLVSSFHKDEVRSVRRMLPGVPTSLIFDVFSVRDVPSYADEGFTVISLRKNAVSVNLIDACHEHRIEVYVWTVDDEEEMRKLISWGVDGIYSNRPGVLKETVEKIRSASLQ
jgi:glycerophosphoryl diester phosphodiesterase